MRDARAFNIIRRCTEFSERRSAI